MNKKYLDIYGFKEILEQELNATNPFTFVKVFGYKENLDGTYLRVAGEKVDEPINFLLEYEPNDYFTCNRNNYTQAGLVDKDGNEIEFNKGDIALYLEAVNYNGTLEPTLPVGQGYYFEKLPKNSLRQFNFSIVNEIDERDVDYDEEIRELQCLFTVEGDDIIPVEGLDAHESVFTLRIHALAREWKFVNEIIRQYVANNNGKAVTNGNTITLYNYAINPPRNLSNINSNSMVTMALDISVATITNGSVTSDVEIYLGDENKENYERIHYSNFQHQKIKQAPSSQFFGDEYVDKAFPIGQGISFSTTAIYTNNTILKDIVKKSLKVDKNSLEEVRSLKIVDKSFGEDFTEEYYIVITSSGRTLVAGSIQVLDIAMNIVRIPE